MSIDTHALLGNFASGFLKVDPEWLEWTDEGFTYWPSKLGQKVSLQDVGEGGVKWRIDLPVVGEVTDDGLALDLMTHLNSRASGWSWSYDLGGKSIHCLMALADPLSWTFSLVSLAEAARLAAWYADIVADDLAELVGGVPLYGHPSTADGPREHPDAMLSYLESLRSRPEWVLDPTFALFPPAADLAQHFGERFDAPATPVDLGFEVDLGRTEHGDQVHLAADFGANPVYGPGFMTRLTFSRDGEEGDRPLEQNLATWQMFLDDRTTLLGAWTSYEQGTWCFQRLVLTSELRSYEQVDTFNGHDAAELEGVLWGALAAVDTYLAVRGTDPKPHAPVARSTSGFDESARILDDCVARQLGDALTRAAGDGPADRRLLWAPITPLFTYLYFNPIGPTSGTYGLCPDTDAGGSILLELMRHPFSPQYRPLGEPETDEDLASLIADDLLQQLGGLPHAVYLGDCPPELVPAVTSAWEEVAQSRSQSGDVDLRLSIDRLHRFAGDPWGLASSQPAPAGTDPGQVPGSELTEELAREWLSTAADPASVWPIVKALPDAWDGALNFQASHGSLGFFDVGQCLVIYNKTIGRDNPEGAVADFDQVVARHGGSSDPSIREVVADALFSKATALIELGRHGDAVAVYDDVVSRFDHDPAMRGQVATAMGSKGQTLGILERFEEEVAAYDDLLARFAGDADPELRKLVAKALVNKGITLDGLGSFQEGLAAYEDVVSRFGGDPDPVLRKVVAKALVNKGVALDQLDRPADALGAYGDLVDRFGDDPDPAVREEVARGLFNKGVALGRLGRTSDQIAAYDHLVARFGDSADPAIREQVARALLDRGATHFRCGRPTDAAAAFDDLVARFGDDPDPAVREVVAAAVRNTDLIRGGPADTEGGTAASLQPVEWPEIRDHLVQFLMLDPEWTIHGEQQLIWQPWLLPVHVGVAAHGQYDDGFPYLAVRAWMRVLECSEESGMTLAAAGNASFRLGSFFWHDGHLLASCGVLLNADGRSNLLLLHNAVLAMATCAHELLNEASEGHYLPAPSEDEAPLGQREEPDELLDIFGGDRCDAPGQEQLAPVWRAARPLLRDQLLALGWEPGFTDASVDFYSQRGIHIGVGLDDQTPKYGTGLAVMAIASPPLPAELPYPGFVNDGNGQLATAVAHIGNLHWADSGQGWATVNVTAYLPWPYLGHFTNEPEHLATGVFNAVNQVFQSARATAIWVGDADGPS